MKILQVLTFELFFLIFIFTVRVDASPQCDVNITWSSNTTYAMNQDNTYYCLNRSWYFEGVDAISISGGLQNSTLDCLGYNLNSNDGVVRAINSGSNNNISITNCNITNFHDGIFYSILSNNIIINNNTITSNTENGMYLILSNSTISNNIANNNIQWGSGVGIMIGGSSSNNNTLINNTLNNNGHGIYLFENRNNTLINSTYSNNNNIGIYLVRSNNNTLTNNIANSNGDGGIQLQTSSNNTLINNTANYNTPSNAAGIGFLLSSNNNTLINNTFNNNYYGIYANSGYANVTGGSVASNSYADYEIRVAGSYFRNTNFTASRTIRFGTNVWFNYNDDTANGIWLKTYSTYTLTRKLSTWSNLIMQWNDSSTTGTYNITGLNANKYYKIYNDSVLTYTLQADSSGNLPSFNISSSSEHEIRVEMDTQGPQYSNIAVSPASGSIYSSIQLYTFQSTWTDISNVSNVILELSGANYSYLSNQLSKTGDTYWGSFMGLAVGTYSYRWFANDTNSNWTSTGAYSYQVISSTAPPTTTPPTTIPYQPPENPTEFPEEVIDIKDLPPPETPIELPSKGLTVKLEKNFVLTLYPLTNATAVVHNLTKIGEPGKYKILLCNQTVVSSYEINITVDLSYYCANYSGYVLEDPTVNIFRFKDNSWVPLITGNVVKNPDKRIICGRVEATPYMITGFQPTPTSSSTMLAIQDLESSLEIAKRQKLNVTEADTLLNQALYEYYNCNYITARALADRALNSLVRVRVPEWLMYLAFILIVAIGVWYYKLVRTLKKEI